MKKYRVTRVCPDCGGWGGKRLHYPGLNRGMTIDCPKCNGVGKFQEIIEVENYKPDSKCCDAFIKKDN